MWWHDTYKVDVEIFVFVAVHVGEQHLLDYLRVLQLVERQLEDEYN